MRLSIFTIALSFAVSLPGFSQDTSGHFHEFHLSVNHMASTGDNPEFRFGLGAGAYHFFTSSERVNLLIGFEYNRTNLFKDYVPGGRFAHLSGVTYNLNSLSIPLGLRLRTGSSVKVIAEAGGFVDFLFYASRSGTRHTMLPDHEGKIRRSVTEVDEVVNFSSPISYGPYFGLGVKIPMSQVDLVVKPEYKFGINSLSTGHDEILNQYFRINIGLSLK